MAPHLQKFCRSVVQAKLISRADLEKHYRVWRAAEPQQRDNLNSFAKSLIQNGGITAEQVAKLLQESTATDSTPVAQSAAFDVELVAVRDPNRQFDRRDVLFALGGAVAAAIVVIPIMWLIRPAK